MKTTTSKHKNSQNTTLFLSLKELEEIKSNIESILNSEKELISFNGADYSMILTKGKEDKITLTFDCETAG